MQEVEAPSRQSAHEGGKVVGLRTGRLYLREKLWYSFLLEAESNPGAIRSMKILKTSSGFFCFFCFLNSFLCSLFILFPYLFLS